MDSSLENMSAEQLQELILEKQNQLASLEQTNRIQAIQVKQSEDQIACYKKEIEDFETKTRVLEKEKESILKEKESIQKEKDSILKKLQDLLEKFSSMKFELSQLKRLVFGSKRERFVSNVQDG